MSHKWQKLTVVLTVVVLLGAFLAPAALAWGPAGRDGWYQGPNGWYQGTMPWVGPQYSGYASGAVYPNCTTYPNVGSYCAPGGYYDYNRPSQNYVYEGYYVPLYPVPEPHIVVQPLPAPVYPQPFQPQGCYNCAPLPTYTDRCQGGWGTFGTYENWARQFTHEHGRYPNDQDVRDFWYSQGYAATHCGQSPW
jgi:hypothetical protein